jgi:hypothetical protein
MYCAVGLAEDLIQDISGFTNPTFDVRVIGGQRNYMLFQAFNLALQIPGALEPRQRWWNSLLLGLSHAHMLQLCLMRGWDYFRVNSLHGTSV